MPKSKGKLGCLFAFVVVFGVICAVVLVSSVPTTQNKIDQVAAKLTPTAGCQSPSEQAYLVAIKEEMAKADPSSTALAALVAEPMVFDEDWSRSISAHLDVLLVVTDAIRQLSGPPSLADISVKLVIWARLLDYAVENFTTGAAALDMASIDKGTEYLRSANSVLRELAQTTLALCGGA